MPRCGLERHSGPEAVAVRLTGAVTGAGAVRAQGEKGCRHRGWDSKWAAACELVPVWRVGAVSGEERHVEQVGQPVLVAVCADVHVILQSLIIIIIIITIIIIIIITVLACDNAAGQNNYNCFVTPLPAQQNNLNAGKQNAARRIIIVL